MTPAERILKMIEEVDPTDTDKLDEIDARFWCFANDKRFLNISAVNTPLPSGTNPDNKLVYFEYGTCLLSKLGYYKTPYRFKKVTRSRDALKAARPEGWRINIAEYDKNTTFKKPHGFEARLLEDTYVYVISKFLPTEELAELHAIVQAKQWEEKE